MPPPDLSVDTFARILGFLEPSLVLMAARVCQLLRQATLGDELWRSVSRNVGAYPHIARAAKSLGWRHAFRQLRMCSSPGWTQVHATQEMKPSPRPHAAATYTTTTPDGSIQWAIFGGGTRATGTTDELWFGTLADREVTWTQCEAVDGGDWPQSRTKADMWAVTAMESGSAHRFLVLFSGLRQEGYRDNETWVLRLGSPQEAAWRELEPGDAPCPRFHHCSAALQCGVLLFGGHNWRQQELGDSWLLPTDTAPPLSSWKKCAQRQRPQARAFATLTESPSGAFAVLFGGADQNGLALNDTWVYTASTQAWGPLSISGRPPAPRHRHGMTAFSETSMAMFGGCSSEYQLDSGVRGLLQ